MASSLKKVSGIYMYIYFHLSDVLLIHSIPQYQTLFGRLQQLDLVQQHHLHSPTQITSTFISRLTTKKGIEILLKEHSVQLLTVLSNVYQDFDLRSLTI